MAHQNDRIPATFAGARYAEEDDLRDLPRASYFMLESFFDCSEHNLLASIEDADGADGQFAIHLGLPDRPARRYAVVFDSFEAALLALARLKVSHPAAGMWLSCQQILAEIEGGDIWRGAINARASHDPTDKDCPWARFATRIKKSDAKGQPIRGVPPEVKGDATFEVLVKHLNSAHQGGAAR